MKTAFRLCFNLLLLSAWFSFSQFSCGKKNNGRLDNGNSTNAQITYWTTNAARTRLLQKEAITLSFGTSSNNFVNIEIDSSKTFQTLDGFGYSLTGGSAVLLGRMHASARAAILNELFGKGENSIGVSYLRISIGASDLDSAVFSYNDLPAGQTDPALANFSIAHDKQFLIPVLKEILAINPAIKIMGSPWSAPVWMKDNNSSIGGSLKPQFYAAYAQYFVKYIQAMRAGGITIDAITPQNEPLHGGNNPSMLMSAAQQSEFIKNHLGPAFSSANINTKIIVYDHNCDRPDYSINVMSDPATKAFVAGSAFHLYAGDISALSQVRDAHPDKEIHFTEQWTGANGTFEGDLKWHTRNVIIGSMRNWSRTALEWNLASDPQFRPFTPGGCNQCRGAIIIDGNNVERNVSYYIIAHASKFVPAGSVRIESSSPGTASLPHVAFKTPAGKKVLIVLNDGNGNFSFNIKVGNRWAPVTLTGNTVGTFEW